VSTFVRFVESLQALDLILNAVRHAPLQDVGDIEVELAILVAQGRDRDHHRGLDLLQVAQDLAHLPLRDSSC